MLQPTPNTEKKKGQAFIIVTSLALFGFLATALLGSGLHWATHDQLRAPAQTYTGAGPLQTRGKKEFVLHSQPLGTGKPFGKVSGPLRLQITMTTISPWVHLLEARVTANTRFTQMEYLWTLPEGVRILQGSAEGVLGEVKKGDEKVLELEVESLTEIPEPSNVFFHAFEWRKGERYGYSDQILLKPARESRSDDEPGMLKAQGLGESEEPGYRINPDRIQF